MNKEQLEELHRQAEKKRQEAIAEVSSILEKGNLLDEDWYPTEDCLRAIELWDWNDSKGWFSFIKSVWYMASWGWREGSMVTHDGFYNKMVYQYDISTAGWSGNESIIQAMKKNHMLWNECWVMSRRGGHYKMEISE